MNKNKIFSAIMRGFEVSGINALYPSTALCRKSSTPAADSDTTH